LLARNGLLSRLFFRLLSEFAVALLDDAQLDTLLAGKADERRVLSDDEDVGGAGGERIPDGVFQMDDIETSVVFFLVLDDTDATQVAPAGDHGQDAGIKLDVFVDFVGDEVVLHGVSGLDQGVGVADGSSVVRDQVGNSAHSDGDSLDFQKLVPGFFAGDSVNSKATLGVVEKTEILVGSFDSNDIHESGRILSVSSDFSIDLDESLMTNGHDFSVGQGVLQSVSEQENQRKTFPKFVGTGGWTRSPNSAQFVQHPMLGSIQTL